MDQETCSVLVVSLNWGYWSQVVPEINQQKSPMSLVELAERVELSLRYSRVDLPRCVISWRFCNNAPRIGPCKIGWAVSDVLPRRELRDALQREAWARSKYDYRTTLEGLIGVLVEVVAEANAVCRCRFWKCVSDNLVKDGHPPLEQLARLG